jgi:hypothetical protein
MYAVIGNVTVRDFERGLPVLREERSSPAVAAPPVAPYRRSR